MRPKTKKRRGKRTHGRGMKAGRGKGHKGGSGNAGGHKHHFMRTLKLAKQGIILFGPPGFTRPEFDVREHITINVGDLESRFPGQASIDLTARGFDRLLGAGRVSQALAVKVPYATHGAREKIQAAGGSLATEAVEEPAARPAAKGSRPPAEAKAKK